VEGRSWHSPSTTPECTPTRPAHHRSPRIRYNHTGASCSAAPRCGVCCCSTPNSHLRSGRHEVHCRPSSGDHHPSARRGRPKDCLHAGRQSDGRCLDGVETRTMQDPAWRTSLLAQPTASPGRIQACSAILIPGPVTRRRWHKDRRGTRGSALPTGRRMLASGRSAQDDVPCPLAVETLTRASSTPRQSPCSAEESRRGMSFPTSVTKGRASEPGGVIPGPAQTRLEDGLEDGGRGRLARRRHTTGRCPAPQHSTSRPRAVASARDTTVRIRSVRLARAEVRQPADIGGHQRRIEQHGLAEAVATRPHGQIIFDNRPMRS